MKTICGKKELLKKEKNQSINTNNIKYWKLEKVR